MYIKKNLQIYKTRKEYINKTRQVKIQKEKKPLINTAGFAIRETKIIQFIKGASEKVHPIFYREMNENYFIFFFHQS